AFTTHVAACSQRWWQEPGCFGSDGVAAGRHSFPTRRSSDLLRMSSAVVPSATRWVTTRVPPRSRAPAASSPAAWSTWAARSRSRSEEHTSELQSRENLVCRLLLEKKNMNRYRRPHHTHSAVC